MTVASCNGLRKCIAGRSAEKPTCIAAYTGNTRAVAYVWYAELLA
jgi:hypothetical protein